MLCGVSNEDPWVRSLSNICLPPWPLAGSRDPALLTPSRFILERETEGRKEVNPERITAS